MNDKFVHPQLVKALRQRAEVPRENAFPNDQMGWMEMLQSLAQDLQAWHASRPMSRQRWEANPEEALADMMNLTFPAQLGTISKMPMRARRRIASGLRAGQYVGAPPGIDTPQAYNALIEKYVKAMEQGVAGRDWYDEVSKIIWRRSGRNPDVADKFSSNLALLSADNKVGGNATMSAKGHMQAITGDPINAGRYPARQSKELQQLYAGSEEFKGLKRDPFAKQMGVEWAPERVGRGVNDMHEAELFGYPKKTLTEQNHAFMDEVRAKAIERANARKLGGFDDWNTGKSQAAAWTANKIRRGDIKPADAAKHFGDYLDEFLGNATYEITPGASTGHLQKIREAPYDVRLRQFNDPRSSWVNPKTGGDILYEAQGALPAETVNTIGRFGEEVNPAGVARNMIGTDVNTGQILPGTQNMMNATEAFRGYMDVQDAYAAHALGRAPNVDARTGAVLPMQMTPESMLRVANEFEPKGYYVASNQKGAALIPSPEMQAEISQIPWDRPSLGEVISDEASAFAKQLKKEGVSVRPEYGNLTTLYGEYGDLWKRGRGDVTREMVRQLRTSPVTVNAIEHSAEIPAAVLGRNARDLEDAARGFGTARPDVLRAREIYANAPAGKRLDSLLEAARKGIVPAVFATPFFGFEYGNDSD